MDANPGDRSKVPVGGRLEAARFGHLEVLKYLRKNGWPWNTTACTFAVSDGHLEVLKYLHENKLPWNPEVPKN